MSDPQFGKLCMAQPRPGDPESIVDTPVISSLFHALSTQSAPDLIALTGDITTAATPAEFLQAKAFLRAIHTLWGAPVPYIFVAGNHDVNWQLSQLEKQDRYDLSRFYPYIFTASSETLFETLFFDTSGKFPERFFHRVLLQNNLAVVVGLNTALDDDHDTKPHHGRIYQHHLDFLHSALSNSTTEYRIVLLHHHLVPHVDPPDWRDFSAAISSQLLLSSTPQLKIDAILHGHRHIPLYHRYTQDDWQTHVMGAGSMSVVAKERGDGFILPSVHMIDFLGRHKGVAYGTRTNWYLNGAGAGITWTHQGRDSDRAIERFGAACSPEDKLDLTNTIAAAVAETQPRVCRVADLIEATQPFYSLTDQTLREWLVEIATALDYELTDTSADRDKWRLFKR